MDNVADNIKMTDIVETIREYLDTFNADKSARLEQIEDLIHALNFEKRVTELTDDETEAMMSAAHLTAAQIERLDRCELPTDRERLTKEFSRHQYFVQCAWSDYLNGTTDFKPFDSKREAARAWEILSNDK